MFGGKNKVESTRLTNIPNSPKIDSPVARLALSRLTLSPGLSSHAKCYINWHRKDTMCTWKRMNLSTYDMNRFFNELQ